MRPGRRKPRDIFICSASYRVRLCSLRDRYHLLTDVVKSLEVTIWVVPSIVENAIAVSVRDIYHSYLRSDTSL